MINWNKFHLEQTPFRATVILIQRHLQKKKFELEEIDHHTMLLRENVIRSFVIKNKVFAPSF
jgi:hypothetical protein